MNLKKHLPALILAFELIPLTIILSSCFLSKENIDSLRYFTPHGYRITAYEIKVEPQEFLGYVSKPIKTVKVIYASTSATVILNAGEFSGSFEMHDLWYKWAKKETGTWEALNSELWWFSGSLNTSKYIAWYKNDSIFILTAQGSADLKEIKRETNDFMSVFGGS